MTERSVEELELSGGAFAVVPVCASWHEHESKRDREQERQRDREQERQRDRETERQRDRHRKTERQRDRETESKRDREQERQSDRERQSKRDRETERQRDRETESKRWWREEQTEQLGCLDPKPRDDGAGVLAQLSADKLGDIGPFQLAIALTVLALVMIWATWSENYGGEEEDVASSSSKSGGDRLFADALLVIARDPKVRPNP